jgi:predicted glycosyltransferase
LKRILIYSHDTFGLGNIRRMLEVARHLVQSSSQVSVLVITGSPMLHAFRIPARIDYVKLPCLSRNVDGRYGARSLDLSLDATVRLRANLIRSAIADFAPDLILVDKKPFGVEDELAGALEGAAGRRRAAAARAAAARHPRQRRGSTTRVWRKNGYFEAIERLLRPGAGGRLPEVFDLRQEYAFPPFAAAKVRFCGYISRQPDGSTREQHVAASSAWHGNEPLLLVTPGGGEDGHAWSRCRWTRVRLPAHAASAHAHRLRPGDERHAAGHGAPVGPRAAQRVSVQDFCDDMMSLMAAADVVVAMGGYNTVCELLTLRKRALLVPRVKPGRSSASGPNAWRRWAWCACCTPTR